MLVARQFSGVGVVGAEQYAVITFASISGAGDGQGMRGFIPRKIKSRAAAEGTNAIEQKEEADANPASNAERSLRGRCSFIPEFLYFMRKKKPPVNKKVFHHKNTSLLPGHFYKNSCQTFFSDPYCEAEKKEHRLTIPQFVNSMAEELKATAPADKKHSKTKKQTTNARRHIFPPCSRLFKLLKCSKQFFILFPWPFLVPPIYPTQVIC